MAFRTGWLLCTALAVVQAEGDKARCYNNGTPGLTDGHCETSYWATPGREVYAFSIPGSASKYACCGQAVASECYIIPTPGGLNAGETFKCTATSQPGSAGSGGNGQGGDKMPAAGGSNEKDTAKCYNNGTPGLTDGQCETSYWATPGREVYAFSIPGSASKYACCDQAVASDCYIIPTPGGLNAGETFKCTATSMAGSAASGGNGQGGDKMPAAGDSNEKDIAKCYNNGTPGLTDGQCGTSYWATPGREVYAFSIPGSVSKYACCDKAVASKCYIIPTPGGINAGETFDCAATSMAGSVASGGNGQGGDKMPAAGDSDEKDSAKCYNNGTPGLTDGQCETSYWATPGREVYAFSIPGSVSKYACCDKAASTQCYIISTPGGLNAGETFDCTPTSQAGSAASAATARGNVETSPDGRRDDEGSALCYNNGTPWLTDGLCQVSYWATPGKEVYAFSVPGSVSKHACCNKAHASKCTIIPTPGGLDPAETFECTPAGGHFDIIP